MDESDFSLSASFLIIVTLLVVFIMCVGMWHMAKSDRRLRRGRRMHRVPPQ